MKSITLPTPFFFVIHPLLTDINGLDTPKRGMDETAVGVDQNVTLLHHWRRGTRQIRSNQIGGHRQDRIRIRLRVRIVLLLMTMMMTLTWDRHR